MARAAILDTILADSRIIALGFHGDPDPNVLINYDGDQRPSDEFFMVLGWGSDTTELRGDDTFSRGPKDLTIWVHMYRELSTDYNRIDDILNILDDIFDSMIHVDGADGYTVTLVDTSPGRSRDMRDDAYQTLCRSASYRVLSRQTATV